MVDRSSTAIFVAKQTNTQHKNSNSNGKNGHENQVSSGTPSTQTGITVVKQSAHPPPSASQDPNQCNTNFAMRSKHKGQTITSSGVSAMIASPQLGAQTNDNSIINASQSTHSTTASHITSEMISSQSQKGSSALSNEKRQKLRRTTQQQSGPIVDSVKQAPLYQSTTEVLQARPIVPIDQQTHSQTKQHQVVIPREQPSNGEKYPRVMQREKRQNKYVPKQVQMQSQQQQHHQQTTHHQQIDHTKQMTQMQYQPLRRPQQQQQNGAQQRGYEHMDYTHHQHMGHYPNGRGGHYANNQNTQNTRRKDMHHHDHNDHRAKLSSREEQGIYQQYNKNQHHNIQTMGVSLSESCFATHVKIFNDSDTISRFQNHPVHAYKPANVNKIAGAPNSNKQARYVARLPQGNQAQDHRFVNNYDNSNQQLQSQQNSVLNSKQNTPYFNQKGQACGQLRLHSNNLAQVSQQILMTPDQQKVSSHQQKQNMQSNTLSLSQPFYPQQKSQAQQNQITAANGNNPSQSLRFNTAAIMAQNYSQSHHQLQQHQLQQKQVQQFAGAVAQHQQSNLVHENGSHLAKSTANSSQPQFQHSQAYQASFVPSSPQLMHSATGNLFLPEQQQMWSRGPPASQNNGMRTGAPPQVNQGYNNFPQSQQQDMQIVSNPLRVKTITPQKAQYLNLNTVQKQKKQATTGNFAQTTPKAVVSQDTAAVHLENIGAVPEELQENQAWQSETIQQSKEPYSEFSQTNKITNGTLGTQKDLTMGGQIQASTESAEEDEDLQTCNHKHQETFQCLTTCTKWYLVASVGNLQVKIPAKQTAVTFSENAQELPILTREYDLIDKLVDKEEAMSTSEQQIIQLNRAVGAGLNPSSSNNISNNGYRKKNHVVQAQSAYDNKLKLNLVGDENQEKQKEFPLHLPINNSSHEDNMRIIDLYMHHRTQQLMCIEFDMTHLKLDEEAEQSFSGEYSDNFSINPSGCETADQKESRQQQPTPFMGVPKNQGPYAYGQPQNVLYINESNKVANQLRVINQEYVERTTYFKLNGECHGKLVFEQDLKYQIAGKKIIKSIQERLIRAKEYIYNEIVRMEPQITVRNTSKTSSHGSNNSRQNVATDEGRGVNATRTHQRTQKSILGTLRGRNKRKKGPYLLRPDQIHIPVVNVTKSLGFKMHMPNLSSIDNMLTNFNQIVMQEGLVQSFFFSFDLPVHQLSTSTPAISNSLVVKIPRDIMGKNSPNGKHASNQYHQQNSQAAFLAYKQHHADHNKYQGSPGQQQQHLQQQQVPSSQQLLQDQCGVPNDKQKDLGSNQQPSSLWNLVDEFNRISTTTNPQISQPEAPAVDQKKSPFTYGNVPADQQLPPSIPGTLSSPFSQPITSSSISNYSNGSNPFQPHRNKPSKHMLSQVSSLLNNGGDPQQQHQQQQQPYLMSCGVSSQNSNLSFHQHSSYGPGNQNYYSRQQHKLSPQQQLSEGKQQGLFPSAGVQNLQTNLQQQIQLPPNMMLPQPSHNNITLPQQFHQALYSLRDQFNPQFNLNGHQYMQPQPDYNISQQQECPIYIPPEDPNYLSNLDRLLEAITPRVSIHQLDSTSITDFFKAFRKTSVFGLRVELLNEQTLQSEIFTFTPTLSSLVLSYHKPMLDGDGEKPLNRVLDFDGIDEIKSDRNQNGVSLKDNNLKINSQEFLVPECEPKDLESSKAAFPPVCQQESAVRVESRSSSSIITQMSKPQLKFFEYHETDPHYQRPAFFTKIKEIIKDVPHLKQVMLKQSTFNFNVSWFSMLWTCQRVCTIPNSDLDADMQEQTGEDATDFSSSAVTNIQFLAIFRFQPESAANMTQSATQFIEAQKNSQRENKNKQSVQLIGLIPYKLDRESFWVSPSHLQTENNLQGEMYDQISEDNIILLQDLKERAIEFLQPQSRREDIHDFNHLLNSTNSSIFDFI